jgi:hypothetical protein
VPVPFTQSEASGRPGRAPGSVDYRFARRQVLRRVRSGELQRSDVCDAQRDLLRVAEHYSQRATTPCPVCAESELRIVRYVFGPRLPAGGRAVASRAELRKLANGRSGLRCYTVEVCLGCRWNHLVEVVPLASSSDSESGTPARGRPRSSS